MEVPRDEHDSLVLDSLTIVVVVVMLFVIEELFAALGGRTLFLCVVLRAVPQWQRHLAMMNGCDSSRGI